MKSAYENGADQLDQGGAEIGTLTEPSTYRREIILALFRRQP
jgi:hypothetical protein